MLGGAGRRGFSTRCIFSGSRGEALAIEPLSLAAYPEHSLGSGIVVAMATISKVIVLSLRPSMKVLFNHSLVGRSDTLPILSWQFVIIQTATSDRVVDPVIAFGRQSTIMFYQVILMHDSRRRNVSHWIGCYNEFLFILTYRRNYSNSSHKASAAR